MNANDLPELEDAAQELERAAQRMIALGRSLFTDFDDVVKSGAESGAYGSLLDTLPGLSAEVGADLTYAIGRDKELAGKLKSMSAVQAAAYVLRNADAIRKRIPLEGVTQEGYERLRPLHRKGGQ